MKFIYTRKYTYQKSGGYPTMQISPFHKDIVPVARGLPSSPCVIRLCEFRKLSLWTSPEVYKTLYHGDSEARSF